MTKLKILHFADAHIDIASHGRHDPDSGLPLRVLDFLKSLDTIVETAILEKVDLVLFAGDAYKDRSPAPTYQREWGRRIVKLSQAGICTLLLAGNHDISPAVGRASSLQEYNTLQVPHLHLIDRPKFLSPHEIENLPLQVIALPWVTRSGLMANHEMNGKESQEVLSAIENRLGELVQKWLEQVDPNLPVILMAHASVQGAKYGNERSVMIGGDLVLPMGLVSDPRLDYVALGHIHKAQDVNQGNQPPIIYPGSIERVDFGEAKDDKFFVIVQVEKGAPTVVEWRKLDGRKIIDRFVRVDSNQDLMGAINQAMPGKEELDGALFRLVVEYPRVLEEMLDEKAIRDHAETAFEFHLIKRPQVESRVRLSADHSLSSLTPLEMLDLYLKTINYDEGEGLELQKLAKKLLDDENGSA